MTEKKLQTSEKLRTVVSVSVGLAAVLIFLFLFVYIRSNLDRFRVEVVEVSYEGYLDEIDSSANPLVTPAVKDIAGRPTIVSSDPATGAASPEITVVQFGSFGSGYSASAQRVMEQVLAEYGERVQWVWKDYYNRDDSMAILGAESARCAQLQNKFWEMHSEIFHTQAGYTYDDIISLSEKIGLDQELFKSCLENDETLGLIEQNVTEALNLNLPGVPILFVGDAQPVIGAITFVEMKALLKQELD